MKLSTLENKITWTAFASFPDPRKKQYLNAPFGPGVYELWNKKTNEPILIGRGNNVASRMSSILPTPFGCGTRNNQGKRNYVLEHLPEIIYRTVACNNESEAIQLENSLKQNTKYKFNT